MLRRRRDLQSDGAGNVEQGVRRKACQHQEHRRPVLATGNPGCQMQIGAGAQLAGIKLTVCHPVELLDESYRRAGFYEETKH